MLAGILPLGRPAFASALGVAQSFGAHNTSGSATLSASPLAATTAGDLLVAVIRTRNTTNLAPVTGITDSASNHWALATSIAQGTDADGAIWYAANAAPLLTTQSITVTVGGTSASTSAIAVTVLEVTGAAPSSPLDMVSKNGGKTQPSSTGTTPTTTQASEIAISDLGWNTGTVTVSGQTAGYTVLPTQTSTVSSTNAGEQGAWLALTATGAQSYLATLSSSTVEWTGAIATFKAGSSSPPTISGFSPTSGTIGTPVTINGTGFAGATFVKFNGTNAGYTVNSDILISTSVPAGAASGPISVTTPGGTATSTASFTVNPSPTPTITGFAPPSGPVGTGATITGTGFTGTTLVEFNGTAATYTVTDDSHINTSVPSGATTGPITVTTPGGTAASSTSFTVTAPPPAPHIMLIVDENKAYSSAQGSPYVIGNASAPYINSLASKYASATAWFGNQHNSPGDYLDLVSGSNQGFTVNTTPPYATPTLVDELNTAGISWKAYMESMPSNCYRGSTTLYSSDHNPFVYFTDYASLCSGSNGVVPYSLPQIKTDLNSGSPPDFVWITPNVCDDMHTAGSPCGPNALVNGDTWLSQNLPTVLSSSWYTSGGIIIITWDESVNADKSGGTFGNGGRVATVVISANSHGAFNASGDHYATLRGIEEAYGVPLLGNSSNASFGDIKPAFGQASSGTITGTVTDSVTHAAIGGATVACSGTPTCTGTTTASDGTYTLTVAPGTYAITATQTGYATGSQSGVVVTTGSSTPEDFSLVPNPGTISGKVTDSASAAIAGATVACTGTLTCTPATTAVDGTYTLSNLTEGSYQITASMAGFSSETFTVVVGPGGSPTQDFQLIAGPGTITGKVTDSVTGAAIGGAAIACSGTPTCTGTATASNGTYTLTVAPGTYDITATQTGYATGSKSGVVVTTGSSTTEDFNLVPTTGTISGKVTDSLTSAAIAGATVGCTGTLTCSSTITAANGTYTLSGLTEGTYQVTASANGYSPETISTINVGPGGTTTQNFALAPLPGKIIGTVTDSVSHAGISGATVACTGTLTCTSATTDTSGNYTLSNLTEGTYSVTVSATGYTSQTAPVVVTPGATTNQPFVLVTGAASLNVVETFGSANTTQATTLTATTATATGSGDLLVVTIKGRSSPLFAVTGVSDNSTGHNVWSQATSTLNGQAFEAIYYVANAGSVTSVTATTSGVASLSMTVFDIAGASPTTPFDKSATAIGSTAAATTGTTPTTTQSNEIVIADIGWNGAVTLTGTTTGYTTTPPEQSTAKLGTTGFSSGEEAAWLIVSATGPQSFAGTLSSGLAWTGAIATFH